MEEIQVCTYVRFYDGNIDKIISITDTMTENKLIGFKKRNTLISDVGFKHRIKKHSKDIIDLIEVGDIVYTYDVLNYDVIYIYDDEMLKAVKQDIEQGIKIKKIWTKEQLKSIEYNIN